MHVVNPLKPRPGQAGFTLAEILVACAIISVGLVAVATGFGFGVDGVEAGRQQSTAVFLAEQRMSRPRSRRAGSPTWRI
jgi:prepilin-type N-terminal cleavage/methylation domain-containing protein